MRAHRVLGFLLFGGSVWAQQYVISTIAGGAPPATPLTATSASVGDPTRMATDSVRERLLRQPALGVQSGRQRHADAVRRQRARREFRRRRSGDRGTAQLPDGHRDRWRRQRVRGGPGRLGGAQDRRQRNHHNSSGHRQAGLRGRRRSGGERADQRSLRPGGGRQRQPLYRRTGNQVVRRVSTDGTISTVRGHRHGRIYGRWRSSAQRLVERARRRGGGRRRQSLYRRHVQRADPARRRRRHHHDGGRRGLDGRLLAAMAVRRRAPASRCRRTWRRTVPETCTSRTSATAGSVW